MKTRKFRKIIIATYIDYKIDMVPQGKCEEIDCVLGVKKKKNLNTFDPTTNVSRYK